MNNETEHIIIKFISSLGILIVLGITAYFFSSSYYYFNSGASKQDIFLQGEHSLSNHTPKFTWTSDGNEGRRIEDYFKENIKNDYANAWYFNNMAHYSDYSENMRLYFTPKNEAFQEKWFSRINYKDSIRIERTDISHNIDVHLYSIDGQITSFTDTATIIEKIFINDNEILHQEYKSVYDVNMILQDQTWHINHIVVRKFEYITNEEKLVQGKKLFAHLPENGRGNNWAKIKGVNYYPQKTPWKMWEELDTIAINSDFSKIEYIGLNTVRIFIPFHDMDKGNINYKHINKIRKVLDLAQDNQLQVIITLFDFIHNYELSNWAASDRHLERIINELKYHPALLGWDLKNEPDLDYENHGKKKVNSWIEFIIRQTRKYDSIHPITIGWSNPDVADKFSEALDYISYHYYQSPEELPKKIQSLENRVGNKPLVLQEFGMSTYDSFLFPNGHTEKEQALYVKKILDVLKENQQSNYIAWTLHDFEDIPSKVVGILPWRKNPQRKFGILDNEEKWKPAARILSGENTKPIKEEFAFKRFYVTLILFGVVLLITFISISRKLFYKKQNKKQSIT